MKLIKSILLVTTTTACFNPNVLAMQEVKEQMMEDDQERQPMLFDGPVAPTMDTNDLEQQAAHQETSALCKSCLCHLLKCSTGCFCCMACCGPLSDKLFICPNIPQEHMNTDTREFCNPSSNFACCLCASTVCVYTIFQLRNLWYETKELTVRASTRCAGLAENFVDKLDLIIQRLEERQNAALGHQN